MKRRINTMSHSQKGVWEFCKRKWFERYIANEQEEKSKALLMGTNCHTMLENIFDYRPKHVKKQLIDVSKQLTWPSSADRLQAIKLCQNAYNTMRNDIYRIIATEQKITVRGITVIVDLVYEDFDGNIVLLDWKTSSKSYKKQQTEESEQLAIYCWAWAIKNRITPHYKAHCVLLKENNKIQFIKVKNEQTIITKAVQNITRIAGEVMEAQDEYNKEGHSSKGKFFPKKDTMAQCWSYGSLCAFHEKCFPVPNLPQIRKALFNKKEE